jgi:ubiquinone/menaquinone biosynthesis C-methylase UbiE
VRGIEHVPWLYDPMCWLCERLGLMRWRRWLVSGARGLALDLGCGTGRNLPLMAGARPVAVDPDAAVLCRARRRAPGARLVRARAEALPFRDGVFDTVVSGLAFCSVADPGRGLAEVRRVLKRHGELRMLEHVRSTVPW